MLVRSWLIGTRLEQRLRRPITEAELYELRPSSRSRRVVVAMALADGGPAGERLAHYLTHTRRVRLAVNGRDLLALGYRQSADLGRVLNSLLHMKVNGVVSGRREELEAARRMRRAED